ncbi:GtrA family protein [Sandarakinorhabdus limnophila]|uniref:GtrA family protein n=1 Tax=Sandarakinorhabdus limnophila TaxID=210512 RepID=UPI0003B35A30|nr:GtrA family protein [Sandarakinorhabdus limnophila]
MSSDGGLLAELRQRISWSQVQLAVRFYQAAIINTLFGISFYALLVWLGLNLFLAQALSHVVGTTFNYFTYSRHVFRTARPAKARFLLSYLGAYLLNLAVLYGLSRVIPSPYVAGIATALIVSLVNFLVLKRLVFRVGAP